jgi:hypothetical protein
MMAAVGLVHMAGSVTRLLEFDLVVFAAGVTMRIDHADLGVDIDDSTQFGLNQRTRSSPTRSTSITH